MSETTIALALLKANWDEHQRSYLDNFNVLTSECLRQSTSDVASAAQLVLDLKNRFGLGIPLHVAEALLKRASKTGLLTKRHRTYYIDRHGVDDSNFDERRGRVAEAYETLVQQLTKFANDTFGIAWDEDQAEDVLQDYLNANLLDMVRATTRLSPMPLPKRASKSERYILASFVNAAIAADLPSFVPLKMVVEGTMLVSAIFLPNPQDAGRRFRDTTVFFDTRFLLESLGHCGPSLREPSRQLLDLLTQAGARLACFEHTYDEVSAVLNGCARNLSTGSVNTGHGPVFDHFLQKGFSESDVRLVLTTLKRDVEALGTKVRPKPGYDKRFAIDEALLQDFIESEIQYQNPHALHRDVDSVSAVIRLRRGRTPRELESSRAIFVTSNNPLIGGANKFFLNKAGKDLDVAPVCISAWYLTSLLWLKKPLASPELPQKRIIADFFAAIQPTERFMHRYVNEVDKLEATGAHSADTVFLLRNSLEARAVAMQLSIGDEDTFTQGTVVEVLEVVQQSIKDESEAELAAEKTRSASLDGELQDTRARAAEARKQEERRQEAQRLARERLAHRLARLASLVAVVGVGASLLLAAYSAAPLFPLPDPLQPWAGHLAAALILIMTAVNWFWGVNLSGLQRILAAQIQRYIVRLLDRELDDPGRPE